MEPSSKAFLKKFVELPGPSGFEQQAQAAWREWVEPYADEVSTDVHGNVIAVLNPGGKPRIMLSGHCDEVGFMVRYIDDNGYLYFSTIGGVDAGIIPAQQVNIHTKGGMIAGVVGKKAAHLLNQDERKKVPEIHKLWIDIGAANREEAESLVMVGDPITFAVGYTELQGEFVAGRTFDDRAGGFAVGEALRLLSSMNPTAAVYVVSTVQEEIGLRGAQTSAFGIDPQVGVAVDVEHASDYPEADKQKVGEIKLGKGPVITRGANINPVVERILVEVAQEEGIPYQLRGNPRGTGTDANVMQLTRHGVATGLISVPNRYMHTPVEVISLKDLEQAARLLAAFVTRIDETIDFTPR